VRFVLFESRPLFRPAPRGRPLTVLDPNLQQAVTDCLDTVGPSVGIPTLRAHFGAIARAALDAFVHDYRRAWRTTNLRCLHVLHWQRPGTVWAMDFAEAPCLIDGRYRYLLAVRDLASGYQLLWQPVAAPTAAVVMDELVLLFARHGAPWLLKTDNGSAFIADTLRWYFHRSGVAQLFSPPRNPAYNGSIEASIGSLKTRSQQHSVRAGHPGQWTGTDVAQALLEANTTAHPRRLHGRTPADVWQSRSPLCPDEHDHFQVAVAQFRSEERLLHGWTDADELTRTEQATIDRAAFRRALVAHDLLLFRRRRILPPIPKPKPAING
jgi:transposase InsO family protein